MTVTPRIHKEKWIRGDFVMPENFCFVVVSTVYVAWNNCSAHV